MKATFNRAVDETIAKSQSINEARGGEYQDSWALANLKTVFLDNLLDAFNAQAHDYDATFVPNAEEKRLIVMASLIDVKLSRMGGEYKEDTAIDLINYIAAYNTLRGEYDKSEAFLPQADQTQEPLQWSEFVPYGAGAPFVRPNLNSLSILRDAIKQATSGGPKTYGF